MWREIYFLLFGRNKFSLFFFQVGFCSKACENEARKPPRTRDPQTRKAYHLYECGLLNAIRIENFTGKMRLTGVTGPETAVSAFACVADTNPDELLRIIGQYSFKNVRFMHMFELLESHSLVKSLLHEAFLCDLLNCDCIAVHGIRTTRIL